MKAGGQGARGAEGPLRGTRARNERRKWKQEGKDGSLGGRKREKAQR